METSLKRGLAVFLSVCLMLTLIPAIAFAQQGDELKLHLGNERMPFFGQSSFLGAPQPKLSIGGQDIDMDENDFELSVRFKKYGENNYGSARTVQLTDTAVFEHAGDYEVCIVGKSGSGYNGKRSNTKVFSIDPKELPSGLGSHPSPITKSYDGDSSVKTNFENKIQLEAVELSLTGGGKAQFYEVLWVNAKYSTADAGEHIPITGGTVEFRVVGDDNGDYAKDFKILPPVGVTGSITPKEIAEDGIDVSNLSVTKTYNASADPSGATITGKAYVNDTNPKVEVTGTVTGFASSGVGGTTATVSFSQLHGAEKGNYALKDGAVSKNGISATITKAPITYPHTKKDFTIKEGQLLSDPESEAQKYFTADEHKANGINGEQMKVTPSYFKEASGSDPLTEQEQKALAPGQTHDVYVKLTPEPAFVANYKELILPQPIRVTVKGLPSQNMSWDQPPLAESGVSKTYGDAPFDMTAETNSEGGEISYSSSVPGVATVDRNTGIVTIKGAGTTVITATAARVDGKYGATSLSYTLRVAKKPVRVKIEDKNRVYGHLNPAFTYSVKEVSSEQSGLVGSDDAGAVKMKLTTAATDRSDVGSYPITGVWESSDNYEVKKIENGTLTVNKVDDAYADPNLKPIKVKKNTERTVRFDVQSVFGVYKIESLKANPQVTDNDGIIKGEVKIDGTSIVFDTHSVSAGANAKIKVTATFKNFTDVEATLTVELAEKQTPNITGVFVRDKEYDGKPVNAEGEVEVDGQVVGNATMTWYSGSSASSPLASSPKDPGFYVLKIAVPEDGDYEAGSREVKFNIHKRDLTVKPNDIAVTAGQPLPAYSLEYKRLVAGEVIRTNGELKDHIKIRNQAGAVQNPQSLAAGTYRLVFEQGGSAYISENDGANKNYNIRYLGIEEGTLTVNPDPSANQNQGNQNQGNQGNQNHPGGSAGSSSGGESSSSSSSSPSTQTPAVTAEKSTVTTNSGMTTAAVKAEAKVNGKEVSTKVSDRGIEHAISLAETSAKKEKTAAAAVAIRLETPKNAEAVKVELSKKATDALAKSGIGSVSVDSAVGSVSMDKKAIESVSKQSKGGIEVRVEKANSKLNEKQKSAVGEAQVYDITVKSAGKQITTFDGGLITVNLPYTLKNGELPNRVVIRHIDETGNIRKVASVYDVKTGRVKFTTDHLSKYVVSYEKWVNGFQDVKESDRHYAAVKYAAEREWMSGVSGKRFAPNEVTTRGMLVTILYRMEGAPKSSASNRFSDVKSDAFYADAVAWASENKLVGGYGDGRFGANDPIRREQLAVITRRYAEYKGKRFDEAERTDDENAEKISDWAIDAMKWARAYELIGGIGDDVADPKGAATRAEIANIMMMLDMLIQK